MTTVVNQTLLVQTQAKPFCLKFPRIGDNNLTIILRDISTVVITHFPGQTQEL